MHKIERKSLRERKHNTEDLWEMCIEVDEHVKRTCEAAWAAPTARTPSFGVCKRTHISRPKFARRIPKYSYVRMLVSRGSTVVCVYSHFHFEGEFLLVFLLLKSCYFFPHHLLRFSCLLLQWGWSRGHVQSGPSAQHDRLRLCVAGRRKRDEWKSSEWSSRWYVNLRLLLFFCFSSFFSDSHSLRASQLCFHLSVSPTVGRVPR